MSFDETGGKKRGARYGDEDEIEQEQEDRKRRQELDKQFHDFARRIESAAQAQQFELEVDMPFRELGFSGVPNRSQVLLLPTTNCLIHLSEYPFTVITLSEVEIVHLERVQFGLKNFDMVFVFNDFKKAPKPINGIPVDHLDNVKEWLDSCDVPISEGPVNLTWGAIMKTINEDPHAFYADGGWDFVTGAGEDSEESESEEGSEFNESSVADESDASEESGSDCTHFPLMQSVSELMTGQSMRARAQTRLGRWTTMSLRARTGMSWSGKLSGVSETESQIVTQLRSYLADEKRHDKHDDDSDDGGKKKKKGSRR